MRDLKDPVNRWDLFRLIYDEITKYVSLWWTLGSGGNELAVIDICNTKYSRQE